jgi:cobalt-zinc-cadmium efflux system membrane fusion protein
MSVWRGLILFLLVLTATACDERVDPRAGATEVQSIAVPAPAAGMCEHGIPEGLCTKCVPALAAVFQAKGDWCEAHGFPESYCPICNDNPTFPDVGTPSAAPADWCAGHGLPESKCTKCNPALIAEYQAASDWCNEHGFPESVCPVCSPQTAPAGAEQAAIEAHIVRFRSPDIEAAADIRTVTATSVRAEPSSVACTARLAFHGDRVADIHAMVPGIVRDVRVELGDRVESGAALFELESTGVGEVQAALQTARERARTAKANLERKRELTDITPARQIEIAEQDLAIALAEVSAAQAALRMIGAGQRSSSGRFTLTAPIAGIVVRRPAVLGTLATEATSLATISDTSVLWVLCDVPESGASKIALGQKLHLSVDGDAESSFEAVVTWIAAEVDPRTRTVTAHAELPNPTGKLRANQFGHARIETSPPLTAVSVPRAAVQRVGEHDVLFVRTAEGVYEPRVVHRLGEDGDELVQVEGRVRHGDAVVTTGAVLLRTEIMPGSIGAGCCEVEAPGAN